MTRRESLQLLALLASFAVAGYAAIRLLAGNPIGIGAWFVGSAVVHDLVLFGVSATTLLARVATKTRHARSPGERSTDEATITQN